MDKTHVKMKNVNHLTAEAATLDHCAMTSFTRPVGDEKEDDEYV